MFRLRKCQEWPSNDPFCWFPMFTVANLIRFLVHLPWHFILNTDSQLPSELVAQSVEHQGSNLYSFIMLLLLPCKSVVCLNVLQKRLRGHPNIVQFYSAASLNEKDTEHGMTEYLILTELCGGKAYQKIIATSNNNSYYCFWYMKSITFTTLCSVITGFLELWNYEIILELCFPAYYALFFGELFAQNPKLCANYANWTILYNYPPKGRWIVVDIYRDAKHRGIYPPLFTDPEVDSCFSIYQIRWIKIRFFNFFL